MCYIDICIVCWMLMGTVHCSFCKIYNSQVRKRIKSISSNRVDSVTEDKTSPMGIGPASPPMGKLGNVSGVQYKNCRENKKVSAESSKITKLYYIFGSQSQSNWIKVDRVQIL